jgi:hypothetical protein
MKGVLPRLNEVVDRQLSMESTQKSLEAMMSSVFLGDLPAIKKKVDETCELQKTASERVGKQLPDLLQKINKFTEIMLSRDKESKKKKVINPPKKSKSKKDEDDEDYVA